MTKIQIEPKKAVLVDCPEAMKFIDLLHIPIHLIREAFGGNGARSRGVSNEGVAQFVKVIKRGKYQPFYYIPPVVVEIPEGDARRLNDDGVDQYRYELVAGHHRFQAHLLAGEPEFYAQIVEFVSAKKKSAKHWRTVYQTMENMETDEDYVRNYATEDDLATAINNLIEEEIASQGVPQSIDSILNSVLSELNITSKGDIVKYTNRIHRMRGNTVKVVQGISKPMREKYYNLHISNTNKLPENVLYQNFTNGGAEVEDYDYRGIAKVWSRIEHNPKNLGKIHIVAGTTKSDHVEVPVVRKDKSTLLKRHADTVISRAAFLLGVNKQTLLDLKVGTNYEKFCNVPIFWIPQLYKENEVVKNTGSLIQFKGDTV